MLLLRRTIGVSCLVAFLTVGFALPRAADAAPPLLVQGTEAQLVAAGCERMKLADDKAMRAAEALDWQAVVASDATGEALIFCPESVSAESQLVGGRVAGLMNEAEASVFLSVGGQVGGAVGSTLGQWIAGKEVTAGTTLKAAFPKTALTLSLLNKLAAGIVVSLFGLLADAGINLFEAVVEAVPPLLSLNVFVNNRAVQDMWPTVLAVANAGFLLALVFIALLTTLRLDVGGGVRRLLPRLLIAALLVNFSLVIAGIILDVSRVIMGLMAIALDMPRLSQLPGALSEGAQAWKTVIAIDKALYEGSWSMAVAKVMQALLVWFMLVTSLVVVFGLLMRYIILIALLIVSPFAYLFIALPGTGGLAKKWWSAFMRYVIYGPVVLFFLIAAVKNTGADSIWSDFFGNIDRGETYFAFLNSVTFGLMMILAALAGRYAGILGAAAAISVATGAGRRVRGMAYGGAKGIAKGVAAPVTVPARGLAKGIGKGTRDYIGAQTKGFLGAAGARIMAGFGYGKGAPPPGRKLGEAVFGKPLTREQRGQAAAAKSFEPTGTTQAQRDDSARRSGAWSPSLLRQEHVGGALSKEQRIFIMKDMKNTPENRAYKVALAGNAEAVRKMEADEKSRIENLDVNMEVGLPTTGVDADTAKKNKKENKENAIENEINRAVQKAYYTSLDRLHRQSQQPTTP